MAFILLVGMVILPLSSIVVDVISIFPKIMPIHLPYLEVVSNKNGIQRNLGSRT
jgi:hypothetical protein